MKIASITSSNRGETDQILSSIAAELQAEGVALCGIVKDQSHDSAFANGCDMKVRVLPAGPIIQITQNLGAGSDACRLDPGAIATAVSTVESQSLAEADLFILNKFGPEEAAGRGFVSVIAAALEHDIPVLVGVGKASLDAFNTFAGGMAEALPADPDKIHHWYQASADATKIAENTA